MIDKNVRHIHIAYLGEDDLYFQKIVTKFKNIYPSAEFIFSTKKVKNNIEAFKIMPELVSINLDIIYIDYSLYSESYLKLTKFIKDQNTTRTLPLIGLSGLNNTHEEFHKGLIAGFNVIYNKSIDVNDAVFHGMKLAYPEKAKVQKVALADGVSFPMTSFHFFRVGYITPDYIHVECNLKLEIGEEVFLYDGVVKELSGEKFKVIRKFEENFYYNFNFSYDLKFMSFFPKIEEEEIDLEEETQKENVKKLEKIELEKREMRENWIKKKDVESFAKRIKVLLFDEDLELLKQIEKELDDFPFSIRIHQFMDEDGGIIYEVMPSIIVFCKKNDGKTKEGFLSNNLSAFRKVIDLIKKNKGFSPFVVIFNEEEDSSVLKNNLSYERVLAINKKFSLQFALEILKSFEEKEGRALTHDPSLSLAKNEKRYYLHKNDPLSIVKSKHEIEVKSMSETFFVITSPLCLLNGTVIKIEEPFHIGLTVIEKGDEEKNHMVLVNGINSKNMEELRQLINKLIKDKKEESEEESS